MGFSISWIAFRGKDKSDLLRSLKLFDTGEADDGNSSPVSGAVLQTGWYVVFFNDYSFATPERLSILSAGCTTVACQVEEHVMASASFCYENGHRIWAIAHNSEEGIYDLSADGQLPDSFSGLREERVKQQGAAGGEDASVDYLFDAPLAMAAQLCGYQHDRAKFSWGDPRFFRLAAL